MGRCYEFGVAIHEGCDHAMVVAAEGGHCVCVGCGTSCPGRFRGCEAVVSRPGYIPTTAPAWALVPPAPVSAREQPDEPTAATPPPVSVRSAVASTEEREVIVDLIEDLGKQLAARDAELGALFDRFVDEFRRLRQEVASGREAIVELEHRHAALVARFDDLVSASLLGPLRGDP